jgi:hypothetical protein
LSWQITQVPSQLQQQPPAGTELITILGHYARVPWVKAPLDHEFNVNVRRSGETEAAGGPAMLTQRTAGRFRSRTS